MGAWNSIYIKEDVSTEVAQQIINEFPDNWFMFDFGKGKRDEKPIRQDWGWSTIADVWNPRYEKEEKCCVWTVGGSNTTVCKFIEDRLKELGYTVLKREFSA